MKKTFYSNGKLLITGEYLVLDGAISLALPTKFGQTMTVEETRDHMFHWNSFDHLSNCWMEFIFSKKEIANFNIENKEKSRLLNLLNETIKLNPEFLIDNKCYRIQTKLSFPRNWGLGSSSTFINNLASWAKVNAFELSDLTFGGSGYDIAAAQYNMPILYSKKQNKIEITKQQLNWSFKDQLFFIHLNKKQDSRVGIANYQKVKKDLNLPIDEINNITNNICNCKSITQFNKLIDKHELIIARVLKQKTIKEKLFSDYSGSIKSLGAWGGDFVLVTGNYDDLSYFKNKGYTTILSYQEMIL